MVLKNNESVENAAHNPQPQTRDESENQAPKFSNLGRIGGIFTPAQVTVLLCQIYAFKLLSANIPVPPKLRQIIFDSAYMRTSPEVNRDNQAQFPILPRIIENVFRSSRRQPASVNFRSIQEYPGVSSSPNNSGSPMADVHEKRSNETDLGHPTRSKTEPVTLANYQNVLRNVSAKADALQSNTGYANGPISILPKKVTSELLRRRIIIPSALPKCVDPQVYLHERERQLYARIDYRIKELMELQSNITNDKEKKLRTLIELKSLRLARKQWRLRAEILTFMKKTTTLATAVDRNLYRRIKMRNIREARITEKIGSTQRIEREKKGVQRYREFLVDVLNRSRDTLSFCKKEQNKMIRLSQAVTKYHSNVQKDEERRRQRASQERLSALKANDEAAYLRLVDKEKDERIVHLLNQTESYLGSLTKAVRDQKLAITDVDESDEFSAGNVPVNDGEQRDYYSTAHRISEVVTQQSSILVGGKLKDYQLKGLQWMISLYNNRLNGILADEMGLGKTIQTISLITYLIEKKKQNGPYLVVVPLSTITNWDLEFERWAPSVSRIVFKGTIQERQRMKHLIKSGNFNVLITTYEFIIKEKALLGKFRWVYIIIDEGHRMKNAQSKLSVTLMHHYNSRYRLILTGTPLQNNLPELWAILNFILPKVFNSVETFDEWFNHPFSRDTGKDSDIKLNEEESLLIIRGLHKVLSPFLLRRLKKDVESELPDKIETVVKCPMSALQHHLYEQIKTNKSVFGLDGVTKRKALNNLVMQFRKVCNHPYLFEEVEQLINSSGITDDNLWRVSGKLEFLDRVLPKFQAANHRVLIFFQMTQVMDIMEDYLLYRKYTYLRLDGHTKAEDRTEMLKSFNREIDPPFIFLLSTRAGGLGLNLQTADTVIIFDSDWNPHQDLQAQDRAHRIGQTKEVRILRLITSRSIEESILARARYKLDIDGKVIQAGKFDNKTTDRERDELLRSLFGTDDEAHKHTNDEILSDTELNELITRNEDELEIYNKIDELREKELEKRRQAGEKIYTSRFFTKDELPASFFKNSNKERDGAQQRLVFGRGARVRKAIRYDDGLNEDEFLESIEDGTFAGYPDSEINDRDFSERQGKKRSFLNYRNEEDEGQESQLGESDYEDDEYSQRQVNRNFKYIKYKKLKKSNTNEDNAARFYGKDSEYGYDYDKNKGGSSNSTHSSEGSGGNFIRLPHKKRKNPNEEPPISDEERELSKLCAQAYKAVCDLEVVESDGIARKRSDLFRKVPSRTLYPDYAHIIKEPMALDVINNRINSCYYKTIDQFVSDMNLMFSNAKMYNVENSEVYQDAVVMKEVFDEAISKITLNKPGANDMSSD